MTTRRRKPTMPTNPEDLPATASVRDAMTLPSGLTSVLILVLALPAAPAGEAAVSFRNQVIPIWTRAGCNSGACHGALAGKGGLKLSLRGYDPDTDHFVLTRQALGRRIDRQHPERSLMLRKPTLALNHGGGQKIEVNSPEYRILADWIASGAPGPQ